MGRACTQCGKGFSSIGRSNNCMQNSLSAPLGTRGEISWTYYIRRGYSCGPWKDEGNHGLTYSWKCFRHKIIYGTCKLL